MKYLVCDSCTQPAAVTCTLHAHGVLITPLPFILEEPRLEQLGIYPRKISPGNLRSHLPNPRSSSISLQATRWPQQQLWLRLFQTIAKRNRNRLCSPQLRRIIVRVSSIRTETLSSYQHPRKHSIHYLHPPPEYSSILAAPRYRYMLRRMGYQTTDRR